MIITSRNIRKQQRAISWAIVVTIAVLAFACSGSAQASERTDDQAAIPGVLEGKSASTFAWVSAKEILDSEGEIRYEYLLDSYSLTKEIEEGLRNKRAERDYVKEISDEDCDRYRVLSIPIPTAVDTVEFVQNARIVLTGQVVAIDQGFAAGISGSLLKIDIDEIVKAPADLSLQDYIYVFYPYARFSIHGAKFCRGRIEREDRVEVGNRALVITSNPPFDLANTMVVASNWELVLEDAVTGKAVPNRHLQGIFEQNPGHAGTAGTIHFWGDDLPDLETLAHQIRGICASDTSNPSLEDQ